MRQLIWKEWHEQGWKLAFGCIVLSAFAAIGLRTRIITDREMVIWVCFPSVGLLPLLAASGLLPADRGDGTFEALAALPAPLWRIFLVKTLSGVALCAVPLACAMIVSLTIARGREMEMTPMAGLFARSMLASLALLIWMLALTARLPTEARAAMVGIGIFICWAMGSAGIVETDVPLLLAVSPFSFLFDGPDLGPGVVVPPIWFDIVVETLIATALWSWASRTIGNVTEK